MLWGCEPLPRTSAGHEQFPGVHRAEQRLPRLAAHWACPTVHEETSAPTRGQAALPSTGPAYSVPFGASR